MVVTKNSFNTISWAWEDLKSEIELFSPAQIWPQVAEKQRSKVRESVVAVDISNPRGFITGKVYQNKLSVDTFPHFFFLIGYNVR